MINLTEKNLSDHVINSLSSDDDQRLTYLTSCLVKHSHAFITETRLTHAEWLSSMAFLKEVTQWCDEKRDELILLSDSLGVSALVDLVSERGSDKATDTTGLGPFHIPNQPFYKNDSSILRSPVPGEPLWFKIKVVNADGLELENVDVDVWQTHANGLYDVQEDAGDNMRGRFKTDSQGYCGFTSVMPKGYPLPLDGPVAAKLNKLKSSTMRPAHIHLIAQVDGYRRVVTHVFPDTDPYLATDPVYGVRAGLILPFEYIETAQGNEPNHLADQYWTTTFNIILVED